MAPYYLPVLCFAFFLFASSAFSSSVYCKDGSKDPEDRSWYYPATVYPHLHCGDGDAFVTFSAVGGNHYNMLVGDKCYPAQVQSAFDIVKANGDYKNQNKPAFYIYPRLIALCQAYANCDCSPNDLAMFEAEGETDSESDSESESVASLSGSEAEHHDEH